MGNLPFLDGTTERKLSLVTTLLFVEAPPTESCCWRLFCGGQFGCVSGGGSTTRGRIAAGDGTGDAETFFAVRDFFLLLGVATLHGGPPMLKRRLLRFPMLPPLGLPPNGVLEKRRSDDTGTTCGDTFSTPGGSILSTTEEAGG